MAAEEMAPEKPSIRRRLTNSFRRIIRQVGDKKPTTPRASTSSPAVGKAPVSPKPTSPARPAVAGPSTTRAPTTFTATPRPRAPKAMPPPTQTAAERTQALFRKHGLDIKTSEWPIHNKHPVGERVQKEIRMRVHRTCHKCQTTFGADKNCVKCNHRKCKKCARYPVKKTKEEKQAKLTAKVGYKKRKGDFAYGITIPSRTGGQDLVYKKIRQRVHRKCHRCQTEFGSVKVCTNCNHTRCKKCPREPAKNKPPGYYDKYDPDDSEPEAPFHPPPPRRTYKRPRMRVHWVCNNCDTTFIEKMKICEGCGSNRDDTGVRYPPPKNKKKYQPTDEDVQRLNDRLQSTTISSS